MKGSNQATLTMTLLL